MTHTLEEVQTFAAEMFQKDNSDMLIIAFSAKLLELQLENWRKLDAHYYTFIVNQAEKHLHSLNAAIQAEGIPDEENNPNPLNSIRSAISWIGMHIDTFWA